MTPPDLVLPDWLDAAARSFPERTALAFGSERWSFRDLRRMVDGCAALLRVRLRDAVSTERRGDGVGARHAVPVPPGTTPALENAPLTQLRVPTGGRIGVLSANRPGFVLAMHAARRLDAAFVPLSWRQTADEIAWQLRDAEVNLLLVDEERVDVAQAACAALPVSILPIVELERVGLEPGSGEGLHLIDLAAEAAVLYTSGTGGRPKGARLTHGNFWHSAVASALHLEHRHDDAWLALLPLFHVGGLSILVRGAIGAVPVLLHERFDPDRALAAIDEGASLVSLVPSMLRRMIDARADTSWPETLRVVLLGGSAAPPRLIEDCLRGGLPVAPTYGLTETASQIATLLPAQVPARTRSSGRPLPTCEVRIAGRGELAATGELGQIEIRGPALFSGYVGSAATVDERTADGWFRSGDMGYLDDEGYLFVVDRRDDLIVTGGENVSPAEVERVLLEHPDVIDAGVVGVPDETWGARPVAAVVWAGDPRDVEAVLLAHCAKRLARFKLPARIYIVDELPRSASGKVLRRRLREAFLSDAENPV